MTEPPKPSSRSDVARALLEVAAAFLDRDLPTSTALARLEKLTAWVRAGAPPKPPKVKTKTPEQVALEEAKRAQVTHGEGDAVRALWAYWTAQTGKAWALTPERHGKLLAALRKGYTVPQMEAAIRGMMLNPWNSGKDPKGGGRQFLDAEHLCRRIDEFAEAGGFRPVGGFTVVDHRHVHAARIKKLEREIDEAERRGDTARATALEEELATLEAGGGDRAAG